MLIQCISKHPLGTLMAAGYVYPNVCVHACLAFSRTTHTYRKATTVLPVPPSLPSIELASMLAYVVSVELAQIFHAFGAGKAAG